MKTLIFNVLGFIIFGAVLELYFSPTVQKYLSPASQEQSKIEGGYSQGEYFQPDRELGYGPKPSSTFTAKKVTGDGYVVYDIEYDFDENGLRKTPPAQGEDVVLFFGCSFTVGEGVNTDEVYPYVFQSELNNRVKSLNFGFHGYGPHQMLRQIETSTVLNGERKPKVVSAYYLALPYHVERSAGYSPWDQKGPKYVWNEKSQSLDFKGPFFSELSLERRRLWASRSNLLSWIMAKWPDYEKSLSSIQDRNLKTYFEIVKAADSSLRQKYGTGLVVLLWWHKHENADEFISFLKENAIKYISMDQVFTDFANEESLVIPRDGYAEKGKAFAHAHPRPAAHQTIGRFLAVGTRK